VSSYKRPKSSGDVSWQVKWRESGRGSGQRSQTFTAKRDAQAFESDIRRVQRLGAHAPGEVSSGRRSTCTIGVRGSSTRQRNALGWGGVGHTRGRRPTCRYRSTRASRR
jgi:hypothetical protein